MSNVQAARILGWTSLAVGATEIAATRWLERTMGVGNHAALIRGFGLREVAAGVAILAQPGLNKSLVASVWARVAGDAADLAMLGLAAPTTRNPRGLAAVIGVVLGVTAADLIVAARLHRDLIQGNAKSRAARQRVSPTQAMPNAGEPETHAPTSAIGADTAGSGPVTAGRLTNLV